MAIEITPARAAEVAGHGLAQLVDVRGPDVFGRSHGKGALNVPYSARGLASRLGVLASAGTRVVLVAANPNEATAAAKQLDDGGFPVIGLVAGGHEGWMAAGQPLASIPQVHAPTLAPDKRAAGITVLDVREPMEWELGYVPGAVLISLGELRSRLGELSKQARIVVICEAGVRSSAAASLLAANGFTNVSNVPEGTAGYRNLALPMDTYEEPAQG